MTGKGLSHFSTLHGEPAKRAQNPEWLARCWPKRGKIGPT
jgi:hypothetical protein